MDISKLCRSCMKEVASWERENFNTRAVEMFCYCTNIQIIEDKLPKQFCYDCIIKIESSYIFIKEAQRVNVTLKNIISRSQTSIIVELDNHTRSITHDELKNNLILTLPDYKVSSSISNYDGQPLFNDVNTENKTNIHETDGNINVTLKEPDCNETSTINITQIDNNDQCQEKDRGKCEKDIEHTDIEESKKNVCPVCRKAFASKTWFAKHMEKEHTSTHEYTCAHCPKTFSKPSQLTSHSASHSEERRFACSVCGKRYKRRKQLAVHARAHSDTRPFACDKCNMRFKIKSVLKCHMKVHEDEKQYLCYFCGWSFAQAGNLRVHMRTHTGERPHACAQCPFRAAAASSLRRHQRRHRATPTHVCTQCRKGFYDASGLIRHMRTHTGELPYKCPGCARAFSDSWKRKTHLMRAHNLPLHDIPKLRRDGQAL